MKIPVGILCVFLGAVIAQNSWIAKEVIALKVEVARLSLKVESLTSAQHVAKQ